jgi:hypothetical protein
MPMKRFATWSGQNGTSRTAARHGACANLLAYTAGQSRCPTSPASIVFSDTSANFSITLSVTRTYSVHYVARRRRGEPISTAFVESVAKRMNTKQQMHWSRTTVQPFLDVRTAVLNERLEDAFRYRYQGFRSANDDRAWSAAA